MKKILIVETNTAKYPSYDIATGLWIGELTEFYAEIEKAGYEADFVSPKGGYVPIDPFSMKFMKVEDFKYYTDENFRKKALSETKNPEQINPDDYIAIYYTGGHGVLWDIPENKQIQKLAENIHKNNGYMTAVCHGVVGLLNFKDEKNNYLINGVNLTGFTNTEEILSGKKNKVPFSAEDELKKRGAIYHKKRFFKNYAISDKRIITGQNPWSPAEVAKILIKKLKEEK